MRKMMIHIFNMKTGMITLCLAMTLVTCRRSRRTETVETINVAIDSTTADSTAEERTLANDGKASDIEGIADKDVIDGWILTCPWTKWENEQGSFVVQYPAFLKENHEQMCNHYDCLVAEWKRLRFIAKRKVDVLTSQRLDKRDRIVIARTGGNEQLINARADERSAIARNSLSAHTEAEHEHGTEASRGTLRILKIISHHIPAVTTLFAK